jgi:iron complex transport system substrate-binding protein
LTNQRKKEIVMLMKSIITQAFIFASACTFHINAQCVDETTASTFEFTDKVTPTKSKLWSITYNGTYKVLTNINAQESYILYQCGSEIPTGTGIDIAIEVPIADGFAVTQTSSLPFLTQLGQVQNGLKIYGNDPLYISDPCVISSIKSGSVAAIPNATYELPTALAENISLAFGFPFDTINAFAKSTVPVVYISDFAEFEHAAVYEWIKFYSAFFNLEAKANSLFEEAVAQYSCVADSVDSSMSTKTTVMWAYYSAFCDGWDVTYPCEGGNTTDEEGFYQYACEYSTSCGLNLVGATERSIVACGNRSFLSTEEFAQFGKDVDVWIYPSPDWNVTFEKYSDELSLFSSVSNAKVYDTQAKGDNDWFEKRAARFFDVLSDFCTIGTTIEGQKGWFRNVFTDPTIVSTTCTANEDTLKPFDYKCDGSSESDTPSSTPSSSQKEVSDEPSLSPMVSDIPSILPSILPTDTTPSSSSRDVPTTLFPTVNKVISNGVAHGPINLFVISLLGAVVSLATTL